MYLLKMSLYWKLKLKNPVDAANMIQNSKLLVPIPFHHLSIYELSCKIEPTMSVQQNSRNTLNPM